MKKCWISVVVLCMCGLFGLSAAAYSPVTLLEQDFTACQTEQEAKATFETVFQGGDYGTFRSDAFGWSKEAGIQLQWADFSQFFTKQAYKNYQFRATVTPARTQWSAIAIREDLQKTDIPNDDPLWSADGDIMGKSTHGVLFALTDIDGGLNGLKIAVRGEVALQDEIISVPLTTEQLFAGNTHEITISDIDNTITFASDGAVLAKIVLTGERNAAGNYCAGTVYDGAEQVLGTFTKGNIPEKGMLGIVQRANNVAVKAVSLAVDKGEVQPEIKGVEGVQGENTLSFVRRNFEKIEQLQFTVYSPVGTEACFALASYDEVGRLTGVSLQKTTVAQGTSKLNFAAKGLTKQLEEMKLFALTGGASLQPVTAVYNLDPGPRQVPQLTEPWSADNEIVGEGYDPAGNHFIGYSDFLLIKDEQARWHAIGIVKDAATPNIWSPKFFHAIGEELTEPYTLTDSIYEKGTLKQDETEEDFAWMFAPYAIQNEKGTAYMYYAHYRFRSEPYVIGGNNDVEVSMKMLEATDSSLETWVKTEEPDLDLGYTAFMEGSNRDACVFYDEDYETYFMYYAGSAAGGVGLRTSEDLIHWSESVTVYYPEDIPDASYVAPESPFVLKRNGYYFLFVSGFDYGRVGVYASKNPFDFTDAPLLGELNGHAPEIVEESGKTYMACAAVSTTKGNVAGSHDLTGVYLQELTWVDYDEANWFVEANDLKAQPTYTAKWDFENAVIEEYSQTETSVQATYIDGKDGKAIRFNGAGFQTENSNINLNPDGYTISFWMQQDAPVSAYSMLVTKHTKESGHFEIYTLPDTGYLSFYTIANGMQGVLATTTPVADGQWHHIAFTYDGATLSAYVDGVFSDSVAVPKPVDSHTPISFGQYVGGGAGLSGALDQVEIFDRCLSADEIRASM